MKKSSKIVGACFTGIILIIALIFMGICLSRVPTGYCGVVYSINGGVTGKVVDQGWHWHGIGERITNYSIGIEQSYLTATNNGDSPENDSFSAPSSDGKGLQMELTFTYRFDRTRISDTFTRFKGLSGQEVLTTFIKPNVISWTKEITAKYPVTEILGDKRADLNIVLTDYLREKFDSYGIIIDSAMLINIEPDEETKAAIQKKITAQQELELAKVQAETARIDAEKEKEVALIEAEKNKETASINAEKVKIEAQGKADAKRIAAEAEAEANVKIAQSLTHELIEKIKYEHWDGKLPSVQGSSSPIIDMRDFTKSE